MIDPTSYDWAGKNTSKAQKPDYSILYWLAAFVALFGLVTFLWFWRF
jgi:hypothetical protein